MQSCPHCGQPLDDEAVICSLCGKTVNPNTVEAGAPGPLPAQNGKGRQLLTILHSLSRSRRFWLMTFYVVAGALTLFWGTRAVMRLLEPEANKPKSMQVEPAVAGQFEVMVKEMLPEKLDWGREQMKHRLPSRFPEELLMETDETKVDIKYENKKHTAAHYELQITYHLDDAVKETYVWQPVTFYFELRQGQWVMVGDKWIRPTALVFE